MLWLEGDYLVMVCQDVPVTRPRLRMLEVAEGDHDTMPHGVTGEASAESIPFQVIQVWKVFGLVLDRGFIGELDLKSS